MWFGGRGRQFGLFLLFGALNTLVSYLIYLAALAIFAYPVAYTVSWIAGIATSYFFNARFVFRQRLRVATAVRYPIVYVCQYTFGICLLYLLVGMFHWSPRLAPMAVIIVSVPLTFALSRLILCRPASK
jgi:putative flippase GtrA